MNKEKNTSINLVSGQNVDGLICYKFEVIGDVIIVWGMSGTCKVFTKESIEKQKPVPYLIDGLPVEDVFIPKQHELLILKTSEKEYVRDFDNEPLEEANKWADYFFEPHTASFYRQDKRGNWYDIEGYRLGASVFLKEHVLCSLAGRASKKSLSFTNQKVLISPNAQLIQIGKLVYDENLEMVHYFGEKITGLGKKHIRFGGIDVLQEVYLGLNRTAFINEYTKEPYLLNNEEITAHVQTVNSGRHRFDVFKAGRRKYVVQNVSNNLFVMDDIPISLDFSSYLVIGNYELSLARKQKEKFFIDINTKQAFTITGYEQERIINIDLSPIRINNDLLYNIKTVGRSIVYNATKHEVFKLNDRTIYPEHLEELEGFENYFALATIEGVRKVFHKKQKNIIQLGKEELFIKNLKGKPGQKLLNAVGLDDEKIVIDARRGYDQLTLAKSGDQRIAAVMDQPKKVGNTVLQNVMLETLGGTEERVIDLNHEELIAFTLPTDLKQFPEQGLPSIFQGSPLLSIDFKKKIKIEGIIFLKARFISYLDQIHPVIIQEENGKPIQLDGDAHQNEIVSGFVESTLDRAYHLGVHRMIGANTLTEDFKEKQLLFSLETMNSWLSFYDAYLPIFKKIVELKDQAAWEYLLFELREVSDSVEYIAVEKIPPYRILVEETKGKPVPKIVKSKEKVLNSPKEISAIRRFFLSAGYLVEVD